MFLHVSICSAVCGARSYTKWQMWHRNIPHTSAPPSLCTSRDHWANLAFLLILPLTTQKQALHSGHGQEVQRIFETQEVYAWPILHQLCDLLDLLEGMSKCMVWDTLHPPPLIQLMKKLWLDKRTNNFTIGLQGMRITSHHCNVIPAPSATCDIISDPRGAPWCFVAVLHPIGQFGCHMWGRVSYCTGSTLRSEKMITKYRFL